MSNLQHAAVKLIPSFLQNDLIYSTVSNWVILQAMKIYKKEMLDLTSKENGFWHFLTAKMTQQQLQSFDVEDIMNWMMVIGAQAMTSFPVYKA